MEAQHTGEERVEGREKDIKIVTLKGESQGLYLLYGWGFLDEGVAVKAVSYAAKGGG